MVKEFKNIENLINYLNLTLDELNEIIERIKDHKEYFNYLIPKRNGSYRLISAPSNRLKKIQKNCWILLAIYIIAKNVHTDLKKNETT